MLAVIMAGGEGTRMRPFTHTIPKPLLPVRGRAVLDWTLESLERAGVQEVVVSLGYMAQLVRSYLEARPPARLRLSCLEEPEPLGTAGAIRLLERVSDPFLVINGDVLTTADLSLLVGHHRRAGAILTVAVRTEQHQIASGVLTTHEGTVTAYAEKPTLAVVISAGIYVLSAQVKEFLPPGRQDMPDLIRQLLALGQKVASHPLTGYWTDIGRPEQYEQAARDFPGL